MGWTQRGDPRDFNADKLGLGAMEHERDRDRQTELANRELARMNGQLVNFGGLGPLPDYRMKAFTGALHDNSDHVSMGVGGSTLPQSRFNEMTPFYNAQFGGDVSNHYAGGMAPQEGGSLVRRPQMQDAAKQSLASMKRKR